jgi:hypothetical protein
MSQHCRANPCCGDRPCSGVPLPQHASGYPSRNKNNAQQAEWQPISTCPIREAVDLWCVYGGEEYAQFDGGASIGFLKSRRFKTEEYGFFGNQSNDGVPRRDGPDLVPVAWRHAVPDCPATLIAEALGIPLTREDAITALTQPDAKSGVAADV